MNKAAWLTIGFLIFVTYISFTLIWGGKKYECEVCIRYKDKDVCQRVRGEDKNETIRLGVSTACGGAARGMTEMIDCQNTPPAKVTCKE